MNGNITYTRNIYQQHACEKKESKQRSAYGELFQRRIRLEVFFDVLSIGLSIFFWLFVAIYVSFPMVKVLMQKLHFYDAYEWALP